MNKGTLIGLGIFAALALAIHFLVPQPVHDWANAFIADSPVLQVATVGLLFWIAATLGEILKELRKRR